ncbi:tetratricopeptide repeat protein 39C-like [Clytia hemisphaerica]|uniref:Uncharacterized protein n=1 Tax=Clytia hemisphaerica TaxID=252671 RepID=A0A7M5WVL3_9CNID|eukprot:TCONS_00023850-protein
MANAAKSEREYDSQSNEIPLPPGMNAHWFAREGINVLLNGGVNHAQQLFKKFRSCSPLLSAGASLVDFITAAMTFEDEKMSQALNSLKGTIKMCQVDSLYEGVLSKKPSEKWSPVERIERMIIWADCELFLAFLMFLKQSVVDFVKAGYHMRRAWKMYEKCHREIHGVDPEVSKNKKNKKSSRTPSPVEVSAEDKIILEAALSFGYGLIQVAFSIVPTALLKVCEVFGFQANRDIGLDALTVSSNSTDMKAPIARLTLLWYHTVVRPFCALDGNNIEKGLAEASVILDASEKEFPTSAIFLYFKALICRLRGQLEEALKILDQTMETSKEQREIALLCHYDKGWCHLMRLEWESAAPCFAKLKEQSRWSEAYYTYLLAVTEGALGRSGVAYEYLKSVPKLVVRKTQLENFLNRKATMYKKKEPTRNEYAILGLELLYLWNALPQCSPQTVQEMLKELESCGVPSMQPLKLLIMGSLYQVNGERETSMQYFQIASRKPDGKPADAHVVPYAMYEMGMTHSTNMNEIDRAKELLYKAKDGFSGYDFENRLNFRIHAALNNIEDAEYEQEQQAKLVPPKVDGL